MLNHEIRKLTEELINQIKAGEVVERPYNVVKELTENALDAGAKSIFVELLDGGKQLIRITDDGQGIPSSQLSLALERHTTNKIRNFNDLDSLASFGFRGEALASIASVSHFTLKSRTVTQEFGSEIVVDCGKFLSQQDVTLPVGTVVQVKDLFLGVPARLKFLKSTATEFSQINDFLVALALSSYQISFKLSHNGRNVFHYHRKKSSYDRFCEVIGLEEKEFTEVHFSRGSFKLTGFAGLPFAAKANSRYFITFVNGRYVKDKVIRAGILQAYQGLLLKGLFPSAVIFVEVDSSWVDVNAHPSKIEVRFYDSPMVQDLIAQGIQESVKTALNKKMNVTQANQVSQNFSRPQFLQSEEIVEPRFSPSPVYKNPLQTQNENPWPKKSYVSQLRNEDPASLMTQHIESFSIFSSAKYLGQYASCYLILEINMELWLLDQHAFHERILFEEILINHKKNNIIRQELLAPIIVSLPPDKGDRVIEQKEQISSLGFHIELLKKGDIAIHGYPAFLTTQNIQGVFEEIIEKILSFSHIRGSDIFHLLFATIACHSAVRAGDPLNEELARRLLGRAKDVDFFAHCPHGRPVIRKFTHKDVSSWFQRI